MERTTKSDGRVREGGGSTELEVEMDVEAVCDLRGFLRYERGRERGE